MVNTVIITPQTLIMIYGSDLIKVWGVIITVFTIGLYYLTLYPVIRKLDKIGKIKRKDILKH